LFFSYSYLKTVSPKNKNESGIVSGNVIVITYYLLQILPLAPAGTGYETIAGYGP